MKIFLDTNVLVSALATRGLCEDIFRLILVEYEMVVSEALLVEVDSALEEKLSLPRDVIESLIDFLSRESTFSNTERLIDIELQDQTDIPILSSAYNGGSEVFITGDKQLHLVGKIGDMMILSPRMYWEMMTTIPSSFHRASSQTAYNVALEEEG
jgi:putative PIN family toxin of toxin-antitoxin system